MKKTNYYFEDFQKGGNHMSKELQQQYTQGQQDIREKVERELEAVAKEINDKLEKTVPEGQIGYCFIEYGKLYARVYRFLKEWYGNYLTKEEFESYVNKRLGENKKVYCRESLKLAEDDKELPLSDYCIYYNNFGEVSQEYATTYITRYVDSLIERKKASSEPKYHVPYSVDGKIIDQVLYALIHFANYGENDVAEMFRVMEAAAKNKNQRLKFTSLAEVYPRAEGDGIDIILFY